MTSSSIADEVVQVVRSPRDKRDYRAVQLTNGLHVVLAHCPDSSKSAAALAVNAGHFDDPKHTQGLAHFLEHMLFLGNNDYPDPSAFPDFLSAYGGQQNAWTGTEYSNFYFDVQANAFANALEYFAAMFKQPLFAPEWIAKERCSIESEFRLKQQDELRRLYQVHKTTSNPNHPFTQFSVGNLTTLNDDQHGSLQDKLQQFFKRHYHTQKLRLVLAGPQSFEQLQQLAEQYFSTLPQCPDYQPKQLSTPLYQQHQQGVFVQVSPVKPARRLIMTLPLPSIDSDYAHKSTSYIAHLLGYEGPGSLYSELRDQGWINSLSAGGGISGSNFKDFNVNIQLTEQGEKEVLQVSRWVFAYLRLIEQQGINDWRYQERKISTELSFTYQDPTPVGELASQLAVNAHHYPPHDVIYGDYRMDSLNSSRVQQLLQLMTPERARITLITASANTDQVTPIYDTPFSIRSLRAEELALLNQQPSDFSARLPSENRFITEHFEPYELTQGSSLPERIVAKPDCQVWYLQDPDFRVPKGHIYVQLEAPAVNQSPLLFACARIWSELMLDALNEALYDAEVAGLHFNIYPTQAGITIHTTGLSAGQLPLLNYLMEQALSVRFSRQRWRAVSEQMASNWRSAHQSQPLNLLFSELNLRLQKGLFRLTDMADECSKLTHKRFTGIVAKMFDSLSVTAFMHGDWQRQHGQQLAQLIRRNLADYQAAKTTRKDILRLPPCSDEQITVQHDHSDSAVLHYYQGPSDSPHDQVAMMLLQQLLHQPLFDELRTRRQLGYLVGSQYFALQRLPGIIMFVQSPQHGTEDINRQLLEVLRRVFKQLDETTLKNWAHCKAVMRQQLQVNDRSLRVRSQRLWGAIQLGDTEFDRQQQLVAALDVWQLDEWLSYIHRIIFEQPTRLRLQTSSDKG